MKTRVISFNYKLTNSQGETLDSSEGGAPLSFLEGQGQIIPGLERQLSPLKKGEKKVIQVKAADAYGERDDRLVINMSRAELPNSGDLTVGDQFEADTQGGETQLLTVTALTPEQVTLDANHPLAGQDLTFDIEVMEIREATKEEMSHGHVHGPGGHHH
ncbi:MAG: peptidylprolyl isomerase [Bacteriovoracia bacterium]